MKNSPTKPPAVLLDGLFHNCHLVLLVLYQYCPPNSVIPAQAGTQGTILTRIVALVETWLGPHLQWG